MHGDFMQTMTTAEAVVASLAAHGIDTVYGVPGVHNDPLFDALCKARNQVRFLHARHEQTGAYMALGAALATGRPQAFAAVPGPGVLNTTAALLTAWGMEAPVLALAGQIPAHAIDRGYGHLHEIPDQIGLLRHLTKHAARIGGPDDASAQVATAIHAAMSGRRRPVALECAIDVWNRAGPAPMTAPIPPTTPPVDMDAIEQIAKILGRAKRPLIVVGGGAQDAAPEVRLLAEMLEAPVASYRRGRGVLPTTHRLAATYPVGRRLWQTADVVFGIGTRLYNQQSQWGVDAGLEILRLDIDPEEPGRYRPPAAAAIADAAAGLRALLDRLPVWNQVRASREDELAGHRAWMAERLARLEPQMGFLRAMRAALPEDGLLVDEVTQMGFAARMAFPVEAPRRFFSGYQDNLGYGYGTALGAAAACPGRAVLSIAGDGGFGYQAFELATAKRHNLPVVVVVFDDGAFGNVKRIQQQAWGGREIANDLVNPDFVRFADSFGIAAYRADDAAALEARLHEAFALGAPALVHVPVGAMPSIWDLIMMPQVRGLPTRPLMP
jgi:acetolactate synthase-1/2/3 large subunit